MRLRRLNAWNAVVVGSLAAVHVVKGSLEPLGLPWWSPLALIGSWVALFSWRPNQHDRRTR